jgi:hypothetical protein
MKKIILIAIFLLVPLISVAQDTANAGFVSGLWYSKTPFFAGEEVRIYSAIQNQSGFDIKGKIQFLDNGELIGESGFSVINGRLIERWVDWKVNEGNHKISVQIVEVKRSEVGGNEVAINLISSSPIVDEQFADVDTDGDRIGNMADSDDDNDGITDNTEKELGTNPLIADTTEDLPEEKPKDDSKLEESKEIAEKFVVEPAKKVGETVAKNAGPILDRITQLLEDKKEVIDKQIAEDREQDQLAVAAQAGSWGEKLREKLPPTFRILYSWLLKLLIFIFDVWWLLAIITLILIRYAWKLFQRFRYW